MSVHLENEWQYFGGTRSDFGFPSRHPHGKEHSVKFEKEPQFPNSCSLFSDSPACGKGTFISNCVATKCLMPPSPTTSAEGLERLLSGSEYLLLVEAASSFLNCPDSV